MKVFQGRRVLEQSVPPKFSVICHAGGSPPPAPRPAGVQVTGVSEMNMDCRPPGVADLIRHGHSRSRLNTRNFNRTSQRWTIHMLQSAAKERQKFNFWSLVPAASVYLPCFKRPWGAVFFRHYNWKGFVFSAYLGGNCAFWFACKGKYLRPDSACFNETKTELFVRRYCSQIRYFISSGWPHLSLLGVKDGRGTQGTHCLVAKRLYQPHREMHSKSITPAWQAWQISQKSLSTSHETWMLELPCAATTNTTMLLNSLLLCSLPA